MKIDSSELAKISHLQCNDLQGRVVPLLPLWDGTEWHAWVPIEGNRLMKMRPIDISRFGYFAKASAKESDLYIPFLDFIFRRAYWPDLTSIIHGIEGDIQNLGTSLTKIDLFFKQKETLLHGVDAFVETEVEYVLMVCRSIFDLLQEIISTIWSKVQLVDSKIKKRELPLSFRQVVVKNNELKSQSLIQDQYGLPEQLARFYFEAGPFFQSLRSGRDAIVHQGKGVGTIFVTERGFALERTAEPFASFGVWREEHFYNENLASLRPVLAHIVIRTIFVCNSFVEAVSEVIAFPPDVAPGYYLFMRGPHDEALVASLAALRGESPWWV